VGKRTLTTAAKGTDNGSPDRSPSLPPSRRLPRSSREPASVLLIPGFCEPRSLLWPLALSVRRQAAHVHIWRDRYLFRSFSDGVQRLGNVLQASEERSTPLVVVTHSFGDWMLRQALAGLPTHRVIGVVSLAPVMQSLPLARLARYAGLGIVPEVPVMSDAVRASEHLQCLADLDHLVVWASLDWLVPPADLPKSDQREIRRVVATHLSIVLQPNTYAIVGEFLNRCSGRH